MLNANDTFLWGATVAAHAVEGRDFDSDWWRWEQRPRRIRGGGTSEMASDHLNRFREDIKLAGQAGLNALQVSISWARIAPRPGEFSEEALAHYASVFGALKKQGITPIAVLQEHSLPLWFANEGAWDGPKAAAHFEAYVKAVFAAISSHCRHWIPLYEPVLWQRMALGEGRWPRPEKARHGVLPSLKRMAAAYLRAHDFIAGQAGSHAVGLSITAPDLAPADPHSPWDLHAVRWQRRYWERALPEALRAERRERPFHFLAVSLPGRQYVHFSALHPRKGLSRYESPSGELASADTAEPCAHGVAAALERAAAWEAPLWVTGTGLATEDDSARCTFLLDHTEAVLKCRRRGMPLMGFCYRSLLDGFEWRHGFTQRYGLIHVDRKSLARTPNPSAFLYQDIAKNNAIRDGAAARYCPLWRSRVEEAC